MARAVRRAGVAIASGYYGALLSKVSPRRHHLYMLRKVRGPYKGPLIVKLVAILDDLAKTQDQLAAVQATSNVISDALRKGEFDEWIYKSEVTDGKATLLECANFLPGRSWKLQLFYIPEGHSHPPHSHSDVSSCLVVAKGTIHAREYNRFHDLEDDADHAMITLASDRRLLPGDALLTTRHNRDVHWFGAIEGPAVAFNFQAVGYVRGRRLLELRRVYVDPSEVGSGGVHKARKLKREEAKLRFEHRPLSDFPLKS